MFGFDFKHYLIDVHQSVVPGQICFIPMGRDKTGAEGIFNQLTTFGKHPPHKTAEIIGMIWEGSAEELERWMELNREWLAQLNIRKS